MKIQNKIIKDQIKKRIQNTSQIRRTQRLDLPMKEGQACNNNFIKKYQLKNKKILNSFLKTSKILWKNTQVTNLPNFLITPISFRLINLQAA